MSRVFSCSALAFLSVVAVAKISPRSLTSDGADFASHEFDYVVVGGGTAGLTVAARYVCLQHALSKIHLCFFIINGRLSEDPKVSVGVIEAGQYLPDDPLVNTPRTSAS
jgi:hypothetical protein